MLGTRFRVLFLCMERLAFSRALFLCPETVTQGTRHPLLISNPQR
nr:MAG TPA: hypothetical protein [Caudoviricetes sp.]